MKKVLLALFGVFSFFFCLCTASHKERYWMDYAERIDLFKEHYIIALAIADDNLYVSTGTNLFIVNLDGYSLTEVTQKIKKEPQDQITGILVDPIIKELCIVLNGNVHSSLCYSYDLNIKQSQSSFLIEIIQFYEKLQKNAPQPSINTLDFDSYQAIVGFFKGNVYLYSIKNKMYQLVYKPTSIYNWPVSAVLTKTTAFVATRGDGLIVVDRKTATATRFPDKASNYIHALAVHNKDLYIGAKGLYKAKITDFASLPK